MFVEELMTRDVVTVDVDATLADAVELLLANEVGSVVVVDEGNPGGLITESDVLRAAVKTGKPLAEIPVARLAHEPVVTTRPDRTVQHVARQMADEGIKKVPVIEDLDLVGIVTLTDIVWHLSDIREEASALEDARDQWESPEEPDR